MSAASSSCYAQRRARNHVLGTDLLVVADVVHGSGFTIEMRIAVVARLFRLATSVIPLVRAAIFAYNVAACSTVRSVNTFEVRQR